MFKRNHFTGTQQPGRILFLFLCIILMLSFCQSGVKAEEDPKPDPSYTEASRPSSDGVLHVSGTRLVNEAGETAVLRGFSTHGLTWYPDYVNPDLFEDLSVNWNCNIVRLAMYSEDYLKDKEENLRILHTGIEAALKADLYVLVDWHILNDSNPLQNMKEAEVFFDEISKEYAGVPNILYEICNEPNGDTGWDDIYTYAETITPIIRKNSPDAVIIVGTPEYDADLSSPAAKRFSDPNTMYTFHFYTASHHDEMMERLDTALKAGLPVFITECGITEADGNGVIDYEYARKWFDYLKANDVSYVVWNLSNKQETSSFIRASSGARRHLSDQDLTECGKWIRQLMRYNEPDTIPEGALRDSYSFFDYLLIPLYSLKEAELFPVKSWVVIVPATALVLLIAALIRKGILKNNARHCGTYDDLVRQYGDPACARTDTANSLRRHILIYGLLFLSLIYLSWRVLFSINPKGGIAAVACNIILLIVEAVGFVESCIHYANLIHASAHPLPKIKAEDYPDVDIFIATYNEPEELLYKTINGCKHLEYPDPAKVHIWVCDDNRRPSMKALAKQMGVGYFDRPDNKGAKAGNLNCALARTSAPYIVTLDADMIVQSGFLMNTIPYFVFAEQCSESLPEDQKKHLGLLQTPQCFYDPDVFQYALYSEKNIPNEQDFFYRTIEVGKSSTNSVIYGGSNTVLLRKALETIGGFYQGSITEDFATGMLIESAGYLSLALETPYASGMTPNTFREHIKQRTRWGRGVISTAKQLHLASRKDLSLIQKLSYLSSVVYWYSPIKNLVYILSPIMFAVFLIPVFRCTWLELLVYWLPMFLLQDICLRVIGRNSMSLKWSAIYETSVMPFLLMPVLRETFGMTMSQFQVTDKSGTKRSVQRQSDLPLMRPFIILILLSVIGIIRVLLITDLSNLFGMFIILFWLIRNLYCFTMVMFLINGRESDEDAEAVLVQAGETALVRKDADGKVFEGITVLMSEHSVRIFCDDSEGMKIGDIVHTEISTMKYTVHPKGIITGIRRMRSSDQVICFVEILDFEGMETEYLQILFDRIPTLPQSLTRDFGLFSLLWRNIVYRLMRTV